MPLSKRKKLPLRWVELCVCVCGLVSFIALLYAVEKIQCDQCYWWAADHRHWKYWCLQADTHYCKETRTHTLNTSHWPAATVAVLHAVQSWHIQMKALMPLGMLTDLNGCIWSSGCLHLLICSFLLLLWCCHHTTDSNHPASCSSIRHRPAYLTDHGLQTFHECTIYTHTHTSSHCYGGTRPRWGWLSFHRCPQGETLKG